MTGMGQPVRRREDFRFITGKGRYTADIDLPRVCHAAFLRSPVASGQLLSLDTTQARAVSGVVAVLTGVEAVEDGLGHLPTGAPVENRDGTRMKEARRPVLPVDRVHHVGQPVACVIAESMAAAREALDLIELEIDETEPALNGAVSSEVHQGIVDNLAFDWESGDHEAALAATAAAPYRVAIDFRQTRMVGAALEGRAALAEFVSDGPSVTLHLATQGAHVAQAILSRAALNWPADRLRVIAPDVGGGFGPKFFMYPEQACVAWASWRLKRHIRWISERTESFVSETHARDQTVSASLGFDGDGRFLAVAMSSHADMGAFLSTFAPGIPTDGLAKILTSLYDVPTGGLRVRGIYSNTVPVDAYRGAGKPPGIYCLERLVDMAADRLDMDRAEIRRKNLISPIDLPYTTALGKVLDAGGDYPAALERSLHMLDWDGFSERRTQAASRGQLRGIGLACNLHPIGGSSAETSRVIVSSDGHVTAWTGTQSTGQGHETAYAQILSERLQVPFARVHVYQGDTGMLPRGGGTGGSSSSVISGNTLARAGDEVIRIARERAADRLEAAPEDLDYARGAFTITGTDRRISLFDLTEEAPIQAEQEFADEVSAFPYGVVGAEVEIDPETGQVRLKRLLTTDDAGRIINPMLLAGQSQGALVQGAGQALLEALIYDPDSGQVLSGSFMDYAMPRADDLPAIETDFIETFSPTNLLGIRGVGEMGANGAPAAIANAVFDALKAVGVNAPDLEPPFTPDRVWRAINSGK
jgi:carbon-monoxide dehydrogenase large subunit